jgi:hypothetical protein
VDRAVGDWRAHQGNAETLSASARGKILEAVFEGREPVEVPAAIFVPARRLAWATIVPAALGVVFAVLINLGGDGTVADKARLVVEKQDGKVVFSLANGSHEHYVYKSYVPGRFGSQPAARMKDGVYVDSEGNGSEITYYRID